MNFTKMNFTKMSSTKKIIVFLIITIIFLGGVLSSQFLKQENVYDEKTYNKRYSQNFKENFTMKADKGTVSEKFKNINIIIENKNYESEILKKENGYFLSIKDNNSLQREIFLPDNFAIQEFTNENLEEYMNSCLSLLINLSYNLYMDEAHKFIENIETEKTPVQSNYYIKDNKLLVIHTSEFYGEIKNLFVFGENGDISITKYKKGE